MVLQLFLCFFCFLIEPWAGGDDDDGYNNAYFHGEMDWISMDWWVNVIDGTPQEKGKLLKKCTLRTTKCLNSGQLPLCLLGYTSILNLKILHQHSLPLFDYELNIYTHIVIYICMYMLISASWKTQKELHAYILL